MLRQELQERLVECRWILERHRVRGVRNGHQVAAGQTPHDDLIDQRKISRRLFPAYDQGGYLHTTKGGAGDRWRRRRGQR